MKKFFLYTVPIVVSVLNCPLWFLEIDARYIDASAISLFTNILTPWYLIIVNLIKKHYANYGILKIHLLMILVEVITSFFNYLGWSLFSMERFFNPDPMTVGMTVGFVKFGMLIIGISFIVLLIRKVRHFR